MVLVSGVEGIKRDVMSTPLVRRLIKSWSSDWLRSLMVITLAPAVLVLLPLSYLRQLGRKYLPFTKRVDEKEKQLMFSLEVSRWLWRVRRWHWTSIGSKMIWWGIIFFSLAVICARALNVFFSWLNQEFTDFNLTFIEVILVFYLCGFLIFQFPPTPGFPIFYASGVIITQAGLDAGWNLWAAWAIATLIAFLLKMSSLISGQLIGQCIGNRSVYVRWLVGVNSPELRAIKYILLQKGLTKAKVSVLLGGPDWPVAVIAGILRTSYIQNIIGMSTILILIVPITLAGAFILEETTSTVYSSAAAIMLSIAALSQGLSMLFALHFIDAVAVAKRDELMKWEVDDEVEHRDEISETLWHIRRYRSQWQFLPLYMKFILFTGVISETLSLYLFLLFSGRCFVNFDVTDSIAIVLNGNALNLVNGLGWFGIAMFSYGCVALIMLSIWMRCCATSIPTPDQLENSPITDSTSAAAAPATAAKEDDDDTGSLYSGRYARCFGACC